MASIGVSIRGYALGRSCRRVFIGVSKVEDPG